MELEIIVLNKVKTENKCNLFSLMQNIALKFSISVFNLECIWRDQAVRKSPLSDQ